jgi:hypothetical protein
VCALTAVCQCAKVENASIKFELSVAFLHYSLIAGARGAGFDQCFKNTVFLVVTRPHTTHNKCRPTTIKGFRHIYSSIKLPSVTRKTHTTRPQPTIASSASTTQKNASPNPTPPRFTAKQTTTAMVALSSIRSNASLGRASSSRSQGRRCVVVRAQTTQAQSTGAAAAIAAGLASAVVMFGQPAFADLNEFE